MKLNSQGKTPEHQYRDRESKPLEKADPPSDLEKNDAELFEGYSGPERVVRERRELK